MRRSITALLVLFALALLSCRTAPTEVNRLEDGLAARERGDNATALRILKPLAEQGDPTAQYELGVMRLKGEGVQRDLDQGVELILKAAMQGHAPAQFMLGSLYSKDSQDDPEKYLDALKWYRLAAEQEHVAAQLVLGYSYYLGKGVAKDYVQAHLWLSLAVARMPEQDELRAQTLEYIDSIAEKLTPEQAARARALEAEWKAGGN